VRDLDGLRIRAGLATDIDTVREIERISATRFTGTGLDTGEPTDVATLTERLSMGGLIVACEGDDNRVAGFVMFCEVDGCGYIEQIDVLPSHAGRRIGAALLDAAAEVAKLRGWHALTLSTFKDVPWNAPYFRRLGFAEIADEHLPPALISIRADHVAHGVDEKLRIFMRRAVECLSPLRCAP